MDNRSNILSCALELFASRGYDAVGVQEIVDAAGITKPTLYHYFGSKRGLLDALLKEHFDELYESVTRAADYKHNLPMTLNALTGVVLCLCQRTQHVLQDAIIHVVCASNQRGFQGSVATQ